MQDEKISKCKICHRSQPNIDYLTSIKLEHLTYITVIVMKMEQYVPQYIGTFMVNVCLCVHGSVRCFVQAQAAIFAKI